jgi:hypothetical protein
VVYEERAPLNLWIASAILGILRDLINLVKFKSARESRRAAAFGKKEERRKADPSPTFAENRRPGFGMTLGGKEARQNRRSEDRRHVTVAFSGQPEREKGEISPGHRNESEAERSAGPE